MMEVTLVSFWLGKRKAMPEQVALKSRAMTSFSFEEAAASPGLSAPILKVHQVKSSDKPPSLVDVADIWEGVSVEARINRVRAMIFGVMYDKVFVSSGTHLLTTLFSTTMYYWSPP
jgi:hypothetical protein